MTWLTATRSLRSGAPSSSALAQQHGLPRIAIDRMTEAWEHGENEIVDQARREAARTGRDISEILKEMLRAAKAARDTARKVPKIRQS
jgi:hypothetical protein